MKAAFQNHLNEEFEIGKNYKPNKADWLDGKWSGLDREGAEYTAGETGISPEAMAQIGRALTTVPEGLNLHKTVGRLIEAKKKMFENGQGFDWATGEALAFGSLVLEGHRRAPGRSGQHPRHVQPAPLGLHRPEDRGPLLPAEQHREGSGPLRGHRTRCCRNMRSWASNTAIRWPSRTP